MLKRIIYFNNPYHLSFKNQQIIIQNKENGVIKQAAIEDIGFVILDNQQITFTQSIIQALAENNTAVVLCDKKHHPASMLFHLDSNHVQTKLFKDQITANKPLKKNLWKQIIEAKIKNQRSLLKKLGRDYKALDVHIKTVKSGDERNREAQASRYYWPRLFGLPNFKRERFGMPPNPTLNYGYAILRAAVARAITGSGLLPTLGIHHHNKYNAYCLADDIMEPYRPFVDEAVVEIIKSDHEYHVMKTEQKKHLLNILNRDVIFGKIKRPLMIGLSITSSSLAKCFSENSRTLKYPVLQ